MPGVTMTMVARDAGVSVSTVSHVINGTRPVNADTRTAVLESMERLGFRHRPVSGSLAAGSTLTVGLALSPSANVTLRDLVDGIEVEASRRGLQLIVADTHDDPEHEARVVARLLAHHVHGLLIVPSVGWEEGSLRLLNERSVPYVVVDRVQDLRADQIGVENEGASCSLVDHLLQRGHTRIAYIGGPAGQSTYRERLLGYQEAHRRRHVEIDPSLVVVDCAGEDAARRAMGRLLARPDAPTGAFAAGYAATLGTLRAARAAGRSVPGDLGVVCFDDVPWSGVAEPGMTALAQPWYAIGARAVQLLVRRMNTPDAPAQTLRLAGEITHRRSCCGEPLDRL